MSDPRDISIGDFDYELPEDRIARYPLPQRDSSKLLVWQNGKITDAPFVSAAGFLPADSLLVFNQSRVIRARLHFKTVSGHNIEVFCLEPVEKTEIPGHATWKCIVGRLKSWKQEKLVITNRVITLSATIGKKEEDHVIVAFEWTPSQMFFTAVLESLGAMPVPPYLGRDSETIDQERYQTIYARHNGSVAAPTAGLHFTDDVLKKMEARGVEREYLTLHVGAGTFRPVKTARLRDHPMHSEVFTVSRAVVKKLNSEPGRRVIAVGTTSLRALESLYWLGLKIKDYSPGEEFSVAQWEPYEAGTKTDTRDPLAALLDFMTENGLDTLTCRTAILVAPPYRLRICAGLFTNFHQPRSTLLLLIAAVAGENWKMIYRHALENDYRFLSYGDSSLLMP